MKNLAERLALALEPWKAQHRPGLAVHRLLKEIPVFLTLSSAARDRVALVLVMFSIMPILFLLVGEWEFALIGVGIGIGAVGMVLRGPRHLLAILFAIAMTMVLVGGLVGYLTDSFGALWAFVPVVWLGAILKKGLRQL